MNVGTIALVLLLIVTVVVVVAVVLCSLITTVALLSYALGRAQCRDRGPEGRR